MTYSPSHFAQKAKSIMDIITAADSAPNPEEWLKTCLIAFTSEWTRYTQIPNQDRPRFGFHLPTIDKNFWITPDGKCALARPNDCFRELSYKTVSDKFGALNVLQALDSMLDSICNSAQRALQESNEVKEFIKSSSLSTFQIKVKDPSN